MSLKKHFDLAHTCGKLLAAELWSDTRRLISKVNLALIFLNSYELGMSNLGFLTVHRLLNEHPDIGVERFFPVLPDLGELAPPFYSFESRHPLGDFDVLAFSISFEGDFDRLPLLLRPLGIPLRREQRSSGRFPLLLAGGAGVAANPQALADIFDLLLPGEAETCLPAKDWTQAGLPLCRGYGLPLIAPAPIRRPHRTMLMLLPPMRMCEPRQEYSRAPISWRSCAGAHVAAPSVWPGASTRRPVRCD